MTNHLKNIEAAAYRYARSRGLKVEAADQFGRTLVEVARHGIESSLDRQEGRK